jgi:AcrR family transcriptional regulator
VGRPREHNERTAAALLAAGERAVTEGGLEALSVRGVAAEVATTTRAVYSLFGSRDGLIVALGAHTYDLLRTALEELPQTADPQADMVQAGLMFRRFALEHPALFSIGIQRTLTSSKLWPQFRAAANDALAVLSRRLARLHERDLLAGRTVRDASIQFHALCEGLAALELREALPGKDAERIWRDGLRALIAGFAITPPRQPPDPTTTPATQKARADLTARPQRPSATTKRQTRRA